MTRRKKTVDYIDDDLDADEKRMFRLLKEGKLKRTKNFAREKAMLEAAARNYFARKQPKDGRITIRMPLQDIHALKGIACEEGLPYQTLISSLLHKFVVSRSEY